MLCRVSHLIFENLSILQEVVAGVYEKKVHVCIGSGFDGGSVCHAGVWCGLLRGD